MADCTGKITGNILLDCDYLPVGGLETNLVLVNFEDVDKATCTFDNANPLKCTNFQLKPGTVGYRFQGLKQSNGKNYTLVPKENLPNKWGHGITGTIFNPTVLAKQQLQLMGLGKFVAVVEQLWKGASNAEAFEILGFAAGLILTEATNNSAENDNVITLVLGSEEGFEEPTPPHTLLDTDYATTKAVFDNLFIEASV